MLTGKDYCDYETCVALKELGYDGYCAAYYHLFDDDDDARNSFEYAYGFDFQNSNNIYRVGAPLLYQAQKWLREEKNAIIVVCPYTYNIVDETQTWSCDVWFGYDPKIATLGFNSYEEALSEGIMKAVKLLKEKEDE